jgi:hypothetical protein
MPILLVQISGIHLSLLAPKNALLSVSPHVITLCSPSSFCIFLGLTTPWDWFSYTGPGYSGIVIHIVRNQVHRRTSHLTSSSVLSPAS